MRAFSGRPAAWRARIGLRLAAMAFPPLAKSGAPSCVMRELRSIRRDMRSSEWRREQRIEKCIHVGLRRNLRKSVVRRGGYLRPLGPRERGGAPVRPSHNNGVAFRHTVWRPGVRLAALGWALQNTLNSRERVIDLLYPPHGCEVAEAAAQGGAVGVGVEGAGGSQVGGRAESAALQGCRRPTSQAAPSALRGSAATPMSKPRPLLKPATPSERSRKPLPTRPPPGRVPDVAVLRSASAAPSSRPNDSRDGRRAAVSERVLSDLHSRRHPGPIPRV